MGIFNFIHLGCKKATFLLSKREEGRLTPLQKIQLKFHLSICVFCTRFQKQTGLFIKNAAHSHLHAHHTLSEEKKKQLKLLLKD